MNGRAEVSRLQQRLDATFKRVQTLPADGTSELQSDYARYLCILVCGFVETAVTELLLEHARSNSSPTIQRFVEARTQRLTNLNCERLGQLLGDFNPDWRSAIGAILVDEKKDALDSVLNLRNKIAHGGSVGLTYHRISEYYGHIKPIIDRVADLCVPV